MHNETEGQVLEFDPVRSADLKKIYQQIHQAIYHAMEKLESFIDTTNYDRMTARQKMILGRRYSKLTDLIKDFVEDRA